MPSRGTGSQKQLCFCVLDLVEKNSLTETFNFYLFSVSLNRNSVLQWKKYGRDSAGFSIGFTPKLFLPDQPNLSPRANENAYVGRVVYGDEKTAYRHRKAIERVAEITRRVAVKNRQLLRSKGVHSDYINAMAKAYIAGQLVWRCITAKRRCWEHQSEVRFVILNQSKHFGGITKTHSDGRPYITYPLPLLDAGSIAEIMIGRSAASDAERWVKELLGNLGVSRDSDNTVIRLAAWPIKVLPAGTVADAPPLPAVKFKSAFDLTDSIAKKYFDELVVLRRQLRNFVAHGTFGKQGEAFRFHSGAGAVPVILDYRSENPQFSLTPELAFDDEERFRL